MGLLSSGQTMLGRVMAAEGQSITISRGSTSLPMTAMPDDAQELAVTDDGLTVEMTMKTFAVDVADLGALLMPRDYDRIAWGSETYEVHSTSNGRNFDWLDNRHLRIAIYTKQVA